MAVLPSLLLLAEVVVQSVGHGLAQKATVSLSARGLVRRISPQAKQADEDVEQETDSQIGAVSVSVSGDAMMRREPRHRHRLHEEKKHNDAHLLDVGSSRSKEADSFLLNARFANSMDGKEGAMVEKTLFMGSATGLHHSYRIPSIVAVGGNRLIAFAEGRVKCSGDSGDIDLVYKISDDDGATWSSLRYLAGGEDGTKDTWGNPTAVFEKPWDGGPSLGRVHVFFNWNRGNFRQLKENHDCPQNPEPWRVNRHGDRHTYYVFSDDAGESWSARQNLTSSLLPDDFTFDMVGPGIGIQKHVGPKQGALVVPAASRNFISNDHGATWTWVYVTSARLDSSTKYATSEATLAECPDGKLYRNDRPRGPAFNKRKRRWTLYIDDPSEPVTAGFSPDMSLLDPRSEGSMLAYTSDVLIFLNSASTVYRTKMRVHMSTDCGKTWRISKWLYKDQASARSRGKGGYSSMAKTSDFHIAALSEARDQKTDQRSIDFLKFDLDWLCEPKSFCKGHACTVEDISSIGNGGAAGEYFHADKSCIQQALNLATSSYASIVQQRRLGKLVWSGPIKIWPSDKNGDAAGNCHGRRDPHKKEIVWQRGDVLLFPAV